MSSQVQVFAKGWYGAGNVGDELLLHVFSRWCAEAGATLAVLSADPAHTRAVHGLDAVGMFDFPAIAQRMTRTDLFALGGGGLFQTHHAFTLPTLYTYSEGDIASYARPVLMAHQMRVPTLLWAQGVGPLEGNEACEIVRDVFSRATFVGVRDAVSRQLLRDVGVDRDVVMAPDPIWALPVDREGRPRTDGPLRLGLVIRPWTTEADWASTFVDALRTTVDATAHRLVWIPFQTGEAGGNSASDLPFLQALAARLPEYEHEFVAIHDPLDASAVLDGCDRLVCMRLHAQILAVKLDRPALCIEYDPKMCRASEMVGLPDVLRLRPAAPLQDWTAGMRALLSVEVAGADKAKVAELQVGALAHRRQLHQAIEYARENGARKRWTSDGFDWIRAWSDAWLHKLIVERDGRIAMLDRQLKEQDRERTQQRIELLAAKASIEQLEQAVCDREQDVQLMQRRLEDAGRFQLELKAELENQVSIQRNEKQELHDRLTHQLYETDRIRRSLSWRLTFPMRLARALLVSSMPERKRLVRSVISHVFWKLPEPARHRLLAVRRRMQERRRRVETPSPGLDWVALANQAKKIAIVPSAFEFDELANQRPINLAKYLADRGYTVVFAAWQWARDERLAKSNQEVHPAIWQVDLYSLIDRAGELKPRADAESVFFLTLPAPELVALHPALRARALAVVYDILDDWEAFHTVGQAPWFSYVDEREAVLAADVVTAVSPPLVQKFQHLRADLHVVGNGYTASTLGLERRFCAATASKGGRPRIGYFGHLTDAWFDWEIVLGAARQMPDCQFDIIGYGEPGWVREAAKGLPNLSLLGKVPPSQLWEHARHWNAGMAPFKPGPLAVSIDPIKVYEYLYLGLPTVCTGIPHLAELPNVVVVKGVARFVEACLQQMGATIDRDAVERFLAGATWEARFDTIMDLAASTHMRRLYGT